MEEFHYKVGWRARGVDPGFHPATVTGGGWEFYRHVPIIASSDPRRVDLRATMRDPLRQVQVRVFRQASAIEVYMLADVSASMGFGGKRAVLAEFASALAYSVYRTGDRFAACGFDNRLRRDIRQPLARSRVVATELKRQLQDAPLGRGAEGLLAAAAALAGRRALVFVVSDFHFELETLKTALQALSAHMVVPIVIWDRREHDIPSGSGIRRFRDPESGVVRSLWLRAELRRRLRDAYRDRREALERTCLGIAEPPLFLDDGFDADSVTDYFYGYG